MRRRNWKALIIAGNVIGVIAIILIIILHNYNTQSVAVEKKESRIDNPHENKITYLHKKEEPLIRIQESDVEESQELDEEFQNLNEESEEKSIDELTDGNALADNTVENTEDGYTETGETVQAEVELSSDNEAQEKISSSSGTGDNNSTTNESPSKTDDDKSEEEGKEEPKEESNHEPKPPSFFEKVQNRLSSTKYEATISDGSSTISINHGDELIANVNGGEGGTITFSSEDPDHRSNITEALGGLATPN